MAHRVRPPGAGIVNLLILAVGLGLVWFGHRLGGKRRTPRAVDLSA